MLGGARALYHSLGKQPKMNRFLSKTSEGQCQPSCPERRWIRPDLPSRCTYYEAIKSGVKSPHSCVPVHSAAGVSDRILPNILSMVGATPLVRVNRVTEEAGVQCEVLAKCEFFNAGGSIKDRIALRMVEDAEREGRLKPGDVLIEPSSGNTGVGMALAAAVKGYRCIIVMSEKMSKEKVDVMRGLGAEIIRTPMTVTYDSPDSHIGVAYRLLQEIPNSHILDQYRNASNPLALFDGAAEEILEACDGKVDMIVMGAGTGGTVTGIGRKLKERCPSCIVVGVDPLGSIMAQPSSINQSDVKFYEVEGIGHDFVPTVLDHKIVDRWYKSKDAQSLVMARKLMREEGFLCGGSSGAIMDCAFQACKDFDLQKGQRCVVILPDSIRNYMTKYLSDEWMIERDFIEAPESLRNTWWWSKPVSSLPLSNPVTVSPSTLCKDAIALMQSQHVDVLPITQTDGCVTGVLTISSLMNKLANGRVQGGDNVSKAAIPTYKKVYTDWTVGRVYALLESEPFALLFKCSSREATTAKPIIAGVVNRMDIINLLASCSPDTD